MGLLDGIKRLFGKKDEAPDSLVFLLRQPRGMELGTVAQVAGNALGVTFSTTDSPNGQNCAAAGSNGQYLLAYGDRGLGVLCIPAPYADREQTASRARELRLRQAILEHKAWFSVDIMRRGREKADAEGYRLLGLLAAAFAGPDCLAVFHPPSQRMAIYDPEILTTLRSGDPLQIFAQLKQPPVVGISGEDPELQQAVAEARRRWPEFVAAFGSRGPDQQFAVKAPISDGAETEFMWIMVTHIQGDCIHGELGNEPVALRGFRLGAPVEVPLSDLQDWMFTAGESYEGGFSVAVLSRRR